MIDNVFLTIDVAVPLGLIINELISNCLKYAFPAGRGGEVRIELRPTIRTVNALRRRRRRNRLPQRTSTFARPTTLGMQLVRALTEQIGGSIELEPTDGTEFRISFPG